MVFFVILSLIWRRLWVKIRSLKIGTEKSWKWRFMVLLVILNISRRMCSSHNVDCMFFVYNTHPENLGWKVRENRPSSKQRILELLVILSLIWWRMCSSHNVDLMFLLYNTHNKNWRWKGWKNIPHLQKRIIVLLYSYLCENLTMFLYNTQA